jgi:hypothetical protein
VDRDRRAWLLYLLETATSLQAGELQVYPMLLRRPPQVRAASALSRSGWNWWRLSAEGGANGCAATLR